MNVPTSFNSFRISVVALCCLLPIKVVGQLTLSDYEGTSIYPGVDPNGGGVPCQANSTAQELTCSFAYHHLVGATLYADLTLGSCDGMLISADVSDVAGPYEDFVSTTIDFPEFTEEEMNSGEVNTTYCARAEVIDDVEHVSKLATKVEVQMTSQFSSTGIFSTFIGTNEFGADTAFAENSRLVVLSAYLGVCGSDPLGADTEFAIGDILSVCVGVNHAIDSDVLVSGVHSVEVMDSASLNTLITAVTSDYVTSFISSLQPSNSELSVNPASQVTISTLMTPSVVDSGAVSVRVKGVADLTYNDPTGRRLSPDQRSLQEEEAFSLEVQLVRTRALPKIATEHIEEMNEGGRIGASVSLVAGFLALLVV